MPTTTSTTSYIILCARVRVRAYAHVRTCVQRQPQDWGVTQGVDF
nr:MAG TPA: hypothetical protein [Microviridae sp.]